MRIGTRACDLGLSGGRFGACAVDTAAGVRPQPPLSGRQRAARAIAGLAFLGLASPLLRRRATMPAAAIPVWFGVTHLLAAATAFRGCPELGVVPSLLLRRDVATECGPWDAVDELLGQA